MNRVLTASRMITMVSSMRVKPLCDDSMTDTNQKQLGNTLWSISDQLRGAMDADDFRDYMLSFLFLRYLSDNYETAAKKELGRDYPDVGELGVHAASAISIDDAAGSGATANGGSRREW